MKKQQIAQDSRNDENMLNQPVPEKNREFNEKKSGINNPDNNDPTREDKPPLFISKL